MIYCRSADCGFILCERVKQKNETPSKLNLTLFKGIWNFLIFFFFWLCDAFSLISVSARKRALSCLDTVPDFCVIFFSPLPLSLSKERGVWEGVWIFLIICFEILLVVFLWNAYFDNNTTVSICSILIRGFFWVSVSLTGNIFIKMAVFWMMSLLVNTNRSLECFSNLSLKKTWKYFLKNLITFDASLM